MSKATQAILLEIDPVIEEMTEYESATIKRFLKSVPTIFNLSDVGHKMIHLDETHFTILLRGFDRIIYTDVQKLINPFKKSFHSWIVKKGQERGDLLLEVSFFRENVENRKPALHRTRIKELLSNPFEIGNLGFTKEEEREIREMIEQFHFVEVYSTGDITTSLTNSSNHHEIIFSNVPDIHSGFLRSYVDHFYKTDMEIKITNDPFEVIIKIEKKNNKKRQRREVIDLEEDTKGPHVKKKS